MNRQYSKEDLSRINQYDAKEARDKKIAERQARVNAEKMELEKINRELEFTKMRDQNNKLQRMTEMKEEYNQFILSKQQNKEEFKRNFRSKKDSELRGTFKIGGENREIKKRTYDDVTDGLLLNPGRQVPNSSQRGRVEQPSETEIKMNIHQRGKSQGYNIINHSAYNTANRENILNYGNSQSINNQQFARNNVSNDYHSKYNTNVNGYTSKEIEGIENLENYHRHYDINTNNRPVIKDNQDTSDNKVKKYYEDYLKQKQSEGKEEEEKFQPDQEIYNDYHNEYNKYNYESELKNEKEKFNQINQLNDRNVNIIFKFKQFFRMMSRMKSSHKWLI